LNKSFDRPGKQSTPRQAKNARTLPRRPFSLPDTQKAKPSTMAFYHGKQELTTVNIYRAQFGPDFRPRPLQLIPHMFGAVIEQLLLREHRIRTHREAHNLWLSQ
jgi:hypothetical protein